MTAIEVLYFDGCPSWEQAWTEVGRALAATGSGATVRLRNIDSLPESERTGFAGSPTVRIAGRDLEGYDGPAVMACRRYENNAGKGWPSQSVLQEHLQAASKKGAA